MFEKFAKENKNPIFEQFWNDLEAKVFDLNQITKKELDDVISTYENALKSNNGLSEEEAEMLNDLFVR